MLKFKELKTIFMYNPKRFVRKNSDIYLNIKEKAMGPKPNI